MPQAQDQSQLPNQQSQMPVKYSTETGVSTHTLRHAVLWSIVRNKFIKGRPHRGLSWGIDYLVYPGFYYEWRVSGFRDNRGVNFGIYRIRIYDNNQAEHIGTITEVHLTLDELKSMINDPNCPESLKDFITTIPTRYHCIGTVPNTEKVYQPDEIERVKRYLEDWIRKQAEY